MSNLPIRTATASDARSLAALSTELGYPSAQEEIVARLSSLPPTEAVLVAEDDDGVNGWIQVGLTFSVESGTFAEIRGLVVAAEKRRGGIGARLVEAAGEWAARREIRRLRVRTNVTRTDTHRFYERCGFALRKQQRVYEKTAGVSPV